MDVRSGQKAILEKSEKQKKNQESMTSQKSKKESSISQKGHLRCQRWPALSSVPQGTIPSICPKKEDNFKVSRVPAKGNHRHLKKVTIQGVHVPVREISLKSQGTDISSRGIQEPSAGSLITMKGLMCRS